MTRDLLHRDPCRPGVTHAGVCPDVPVKLFHWANLTLILSKYDSPIVGGPHKGPQQGAAAPDSWGPRQTGLTPAPVSFFGLSVISFIVLSLSERRMRAEEKREREREEGIGSNIMSVHSHEISCAARWRRLRYSKSAFPLALHALIVCHLTIRPTDLER